MILPQWTEKYSQGEGGRDHLAYEYVGVLMLERLLPGISNITRRARYYSFFAWVIYRFLQSSEKKNHSAFRKYLKIKSLAFLYGNGLLHIDESHTGIDGILFLRSYLQNHDGTKFNWDDKTVKSFRDNYWIYSQKLEQMGIAAGHNDYGVDGLTRPRGTELAAAFEKSISGTQYFKEYCDKNDLGIPASVLKGYGEVGGVLELKKCREEQALLTDCFFRFNDLEHEEGDPAFYYITGGFDGLQRARRESLLLYMDVINKSKNLLDYDELRKIQYFSKIQPDLYRPNEKLKVNLEFWRIFQARQYFVYSIEAIFRAMTLMIKDKSMTSDSLLTKLFDSADLGAVEKEYGIKIRAKEPLKEVFTQISRHKSSELFDKSCTLKSKLNEESLYQAIQGDGYTQLFIYPLLILIIIYLRLDHYRKNESPFWEFGKIGGNTNLGLDKFFADIEKMANNGATIEEFMRFAMNEYIISQHTYVAFNKLSWYQHDTRHFSYEGGILTGLLIANTKINASKFDNVMLILGDLGLISSKNGQYSLTDRGNKILSKL